MNIEKIYIIKHFNVKIMILIFELLNLSLTGELSPTSRVLIIIPLWAKRVGNLLQMGIKKITHTFREWICHDSVTQWLCVGSSVSLWLCHSVDNKRSNISAALHPIGPNNVPKWFFISSKGRLGLGRGPKKYVFFKLSQPFEIDKVWKLKLKPKIEKQN